jgi:hypothetical protein
MSRNRARSAVLLACIVGPLLPPALCAVSATAAAWFDAHWWAPVADTLALSVCVAILRRTSDAPIRLTRDNVFWHTVFVGCLWVIVLT